MTDFPKDRIFHVKCTTFFDLNWWLKLCFKLYKMWCNKEKSCIISIKALCKVIKIWYMFIKIWWKPVIFCFKCIKPRWISPNFSMKTQQVLMKGIHIWDKLQQIMGSFLEFLIKLLEFWNSQNKKINGETRNRTSDPLIK